MDQVKEVGGLWSGPGGQEKRGQQAGPGPGNTRGARVALRALSLHSAGTWDLEKGPQDIPSSAWQGQYTVI